MSIQTVKLSDLKPPTDNPRRFICARALQGLAASIRNDGLLQNLVVRPIKGQGKNKTKSFRVVSGERRFRALRLLQGQGHIDGDYQVPVKVRVNLSKDDTLRLATIENLQRQDLAPLDAAQALARLIRDGEKLDDIVARTGLSATTVKRRVALCTLCAEAQDALRDGRVTLAQAEALTLGDHDRQRDLLDDLARGYSDYSAADMRGFLLDERPNVAMAVFPVEDYTGTITTDLFAEGEESYFDDLEQFFELQRQAVEELAAGYEGKADWVEVTDSYRIPDWQYREAEDGEESGVLINFSPSGRVEIREGLAKPQSDAGTRGATADHPDAPKKAKAAYSAPLCRYIGWHKTRAVQELLLADPRKAREVALVAALKNLAPHEGVRALAEAEEPQRAYGVLESQARLFAGWLGFVLDSDESLWSQFPPRFCDELTLYEALKALTDHELDQLHTLLAALSFGQDDCNRLDSDDSLFNRVAQDLGVDMRNHWQPDRAFFERRTTAQLVVIAKECGYADGVGTVGSFKKSELVNALLRHFANAYAASSPIAAQQKARDWLPEAMAFPAIDPDSQEEEAEHAGDPAEGAFAEAA